MFYAFIAAVIICLGMSLKGLLLPTEKGERISLEHLYWIITVYFIFLIGFGLLYVLMDLKFGSVTSSLLLIKRQKMECLETMA